MRSDNLQSSGQPIPAGIFAGSQDRRYGITGGPYTGFEGSFLWVAEGVDGSDNSRSNPAVVTLTSLATPGYSGLVFTGLFGGTLADTTDYMRVSYSPDGGAFVEALDFVTTATGNGMAIALDTDNDGRGDAGAGDGNVLGVALKPFSFALPPAASLRLRVEIFSDGNDEFAFDDFQITGLIPEPTTGALALAGLALAWPIKRRRPARR
jgi:hypothetical protein